MKKIFIAVFILAISDSFCQSPTDTNQQELNFQSVEKSFKSIKANEIHNYNVTDTIMEPEAYLIQNFNGKSGTVSIAIKDNDAFKIYELIPNGNRANDTLKSDEKSDKFLMNRPVAYSNILEIKRVRLDRFKNEELILKFSYRNVSCPNCSQTQASITNGYIIFDFDKLQFLKLINLQATLLAQQLNEFEKLENFKIEFKKNYVKMKKRKYVYKDDKLVRK